MVLIKGTWPFGDFICEMQGNVMMICGAVSIIILGMITINRYVKIVRSASLYQKIFCKRNVLKSIATSSICAVFAVVGAFFLGGEVLCNDPGKSVCLIKLDMTNKVGLFISFLLLLL